MFATVLGWRMGHAAAQGRIGIVPSVNDGMGGGLVEGTSFASLLAITFSTDIVASCEWGECSCVEVMKEQKAFIFSTYLNLQA